MLGRERKMKFAKVGNRKHGSTDSAVVIIVVYIMYLHDPRPSAEDPPVEFLRSGAENPLSDLPRPGAEQIFFSI